MNRCEQERREFGCEFNREELPTHAMACSEMGHVSVPFFPSFSGSQHVMPGCSTKERWIADPKCHSFLQVCSSVMPCTAGIGRKCIRASYLRPNSLIALQTGMKTGNWNRHRYQRCPFLLAPPYRERHQMAAARIRRARVIAGRMGSKRQNKRENVEVRPTRRIEFRRVEAPRVQLSQRWIGSPCADPTLVQMAGQN